MAHTSNINTRHRLTQIIVLVMLILSGVLFSQLAKAQGPNQHVRFHKEAKYHIKVHKSSSKACALLHKKRLSLPKHTLFASNSKPRSSRNREVLAETDEPQTNASVN